jgi:hypothetical protein
MRRWISRHYRRDQVREDQYDFFRKRLRLCKNDTLRRPDRTAHVHALQARIGFLVGALGALGASHGPEHNRRGHSRQGGVLGVAACNRAPNASPCSYDDHQAAASELGRPPLPPVATSGTTVHFFCETVQRR